MKIHKIKIENYDDKINSLELDFLKEDGSPYDNIIFIGENGTFKTSILNLIFDLFNNNYGKENSHCSILFSLSEEENEAFLEKYKNRAQPNTLDFFKSGVYVLEGVSGRFLLLDRDSKVLLFNANGLFAEKEFKVVFSEALSNFQNQEVPSVTNQTIDNLVKSRKTSPNLPREIKQLLVDIIIQDMVEMASEIQRVRENHNEGIINEIIDKERRFTRFEKAFNNFFEGKSIVKTENNLDIMFKEGNRIYSIDKLSSGEKQIVFRGSFLLKDKNAEKGAIILIDEPEISMHPNWQIKILDFFREIFTEKGKQKSQIFIATHSPYILQNSKDCCVVVLKKDGENLEIEKRKGFYGWTPDQITESVFNVNLRPKEIIEKLNKFKKLVTESYNKEEKEKEFFEIYKELSLYLKPGDYELLSMKIFDLYKKIKLQVDEKD